MKSTGYLIVRVSTAQQAFPVSGAAVTVYETPSGSAVASSSTDESGQSDRFELPAPPIENSESPNQSNPFLSYTVRVSHPNYASVQASGVAVFPGITSSLPVSMIPSCLCTGEETILQIQTGPTGAGGAHG